MKKIIKMESVQLLVFSAISSCMGWTITVLIILIALPKVDVSWNENIIVGGSFVGVVFSWLLGYWMIKKLFTEAVITEKDE